jgi:predicted RecA/RadA family phage recombinase
LYLDLDDASFTNTPDGDQDENSTNEDVSIALRDIKAGEEITISYSGLTIDLDWYKPMKRAAWVEGYEVSSSSTDEEVETEQNSEDSDPPKEETVQHPGKVKRYLGNSTGLPRKETSSVSDNYLLHEWKLEGCWRKGQSTTIFKQATWEYLQDAYRRAVPSGTSTIAIEPTSGVMVPHEIRLIPGKGRGLFATKNIKKGEVIWKNIQSAEFEDELSWRRFVSSIPYELACDVHQWAYVEYDEDDKISILYLDLDDGSFTNTPDGDQDENSTTEEVSIALRDIKAGEEITMSYSGLLLILIGISE